MSKPVKPRPLAPHAAIRVIAPASPPEEAKLQRGCDELAALGYKLRVDRSSVLAQDAYFAGCVEHRRSALQTALDEPGTAAVFCARGGYGCDCLLKDAKGKFRKRRPKLFLGYSDITSLHIFLWRKLRWVTFYGPMVAAGFDQGHAGAIDARVSGASAKQAATAGSGLHDGGPAHSGPPDGARHPGYDLESFRLAMTETKRGYSLDLRGEPLRQGTAQGALLGGCLTLLQTTLGTPWELETRGAILLLEDCHMKPYQVDRALMHLKNAGKFDGVRGIIFGEFPNCAAPPPSTTAVGDIFARLAQALKVPVLWNVPFGHSSRPMLTFPLGIRAELQSAAGGHLNFLEPPCAS